MAKEASAENKKQAVAAPKELPTAPVIPLRANKVGTDNQTKPVKRPQIFRRQLLAISFIACVVIPTLLGIVYYGFVASDRYAASAGFSVRSMDAGATGTDFLGTLTGLSSVGTTTTDSYILLEYMKSRELLDRLRSDVDFQAAYGDDNIDFLYRLSENLPIEKVIDYWKWMISTSYDNSSEIIKFEVQAFSAEEAKKIAALVVKYSQELINKLSEQARNDAVLFAKKEVSTAELRLKLIRDELRQFRAQSNAVDPAATAAASLELITQLEGQLIQEQAQLASLRSSLNERSPSVQQSKIRIKALSKEIELKKNEIGGTNADGNETNLSVLLANYERLRADQEFAQSAYTTALASLERSRVEADRQQRFLAVFKQPSVPQDAIYPDRILNVILILVATLILWSIGTLIAYSIRDHLR